MLLRQFPHSVAASAGVVFLVLILFWRLSQDNFSNPILDVTNVATASPKWAHDIFNNTLGVSRI